MSRPSPAQRPAERPSYQRPAQRPSYQRPAERPSYQRPSPSYQRPAQRPSYQRPAERPSPSYQRPPQRPSPSYQRPSPSQYYEHPAPIRPAAPAATRRPQSSGWVHSESNGWNKAPPSRPWLGAEQKRPATSGTQPTSSERPAPNANWVHSDNGWNRRPGSPQSDNGKKPAPGGHPTRPSGDQGHPVIQHQGSKPVQNAQHPMMGERFQQRPPMNSGSDRHSMHPQGPLRPGTYVPSRPGPFYKGVRPATFDHTPDHVHSDHTRPATDGTRPYYRDRHGDYHDHDRYDRDDHRPSYRHVRPYPYAPYGPPSYWYYRPWYTQWWVDPYWRYCYATSMVVGFPFLTWAWDDWWVPPPRPGWMWVPGYWYYGAYYPGYWRPDYSTPMGYAYVPGFWSGNSYVEGYYRQSARSDWTWVDGYYLQDGTYVEGHWQPNKGGPAGYVWEPGFFDGHTYVDGFWRPEYRSGYTWVAAYYDNQGVRHNGYWLPLQDEPGKVWIPGWFDGQKWITGYWVSQSEYQNHNPANDQAPPAVSSGWQQDQQVPRSVQGTSSAQGTPIASNTPSANEQASGGTGEEAAIALPVNYDHSKGTSATATQPTNGPAPTLQVHLANYDFSHYPQVTLDLSVDWEKGRASGTATGWKVEVWDAGANVTPKVTYLRQVDADTDMLRVTYQARRQDNGQRDVVVRLTRDGDTNGYQGTTFEIP